MSCGSSAIITLSGDAIAKCNRNSVGIYVTYVPQLEGPEMFVNKHNDLLIRCLHGDNIKLNVQFFDNKGNTDGSEVTSNIDLGTEFNYYPEAVEWQVNKIDAICDKNFTPVGIIFGPESKLACAFKNILKQRGIKVSKLPAENSTWKKVFGSGSYTCDADSDNLPGVYDRLVSVLKNIGLIKPEYKCEKKGGEMAMQKEKVMTKEMAMQKEKVMAKPMQMQQGGEMAKVMEKEKVMAKMMEMQKEMAKEKAMQMHQGGENKNNSSMKGLLKKLNTLVDKL